MNAIVSRATEVQAHVIESTNNKRERVSSAVSGFIGGAKDVMGGIVDGVGKGFAIGTGATIGVCTGSSIINGFFDLLDGLC